jgi:serine/threonine-protein kinase
MNLPLAEEVPIRPGDVLAGKYRVEQLLGRGGMGVVVSAMHLQLEERVALKFLLPTALSNAEAVGRFIREARAAAKIKNEHVARVIDVGQLEDNSPYMVMEYLEGGDLAAWLRQRGAFPVQLAVDMILQACEAIADAHALGIVHRDLKPGNLFVTQRSDGKLTLKVLDFGISKIMVPGSGGLDMTKTSALMGSPFYMSPEQLTMSKGVDARTDIWALGIILYELLSGRPPFDAEAVTELAIKIANDPAPLLRLSRPDVPPGLELVVATCLAKDRTKRFQTVGDLAARLVEFGPPHARASADRVLGTLRQAGVGAAMQPALMQPAMMQPSFAELRPPVAPVNTMATWGQTGTRSHPGRTIAAVSALAAVLAVGLGVTLVLRGGSSTGSASTATSAAATAAEPPPAPVPLPPAATLPPPATATPASPPATTAAAAPPPASAAPPVPTPPASVATPAASEAPKPAPPKPFFGGSVRPKADCDPPYTVNAKGSRIFKPECM